MLVLHIRTHLTPLSYAMMHKINEERRQYTELYAGSACKQAAMVSQYYSVEVLRRAPVIIKVMQPNMDLSWPMCILVLNCGMSILGVLIEGLQCFSHCNNDTFILQDKTETMIEEVQSIVEQIFTKARRDVLCLPSIYYHFLPQFVGGYDKSACSLWNQSGPFQGSFC